MTTERIERRLTVIVSADVVAYSRLIEADEAGTRAALNTHRRELIDPKLAEHHGRLVSTAGDSLLVEFGSAVEAVQCAVEMQRGMTERNADIPEDHRIVFRIGINLGEVIVEGDDIHGDGVNVAARLQALAEPGGICVSGKVYEETHQRLDAPFEDLGEQTVKNIARPIKAYAVRESRGEPKTLGGESDELPLPSKPSIAVLPFDNMSGDPEQEYFSDGIADDIITGLSRFRDLFVIARNSSFTYKGSAVDIKQVGHELGVRYVLEGGVRKAGERMRISAQLIEATTGNHIWAERYDRKLNDIFDLQDEVTETIVAAIMPELAGVERERAKRKRPERLDAWDSYQRAMFHFYLYTPNDNAEAKRLLHSAIDMDAQFGSAFAGLAMSYVIDLAIGWAEPSEELHEKMFKAARRAVALDERDPTAHLALGWTYTSMGDHESAIAECSSAIELNPSYAEGYEGLGYALERSCRDEEAIEQFDNAIRLSPHSPNIWISQTLKSYCLVTLRRHEEALRWAKMAVRHPNAQFWPYLYVASALAHLDRMDEARAALEEALRRRPDFSRSLFDQIMASDNPAHFDHLFDGLYKAGLPT